MKAIINGNIVTESEIIEGGAILFSDKIEKIGKDIDVSAVDEVIDAAGAYVLPGLVDVHIHGFKDHDTMDADPAGLLKMAKDLTENGVTAFCPTTMTVAVSEIEAALDVIRQVKETDHPGARVLGANVEGPFISPVRRGAQAEAHILPPDGDFIVKHKDIVKLVTLAPEMEGSMEFIKKVTAETDAVISIGHSEADYETAKEAFRLGARHNTHFFNAMTVFHHLRPGIITAAWENDAVTCELIGDTFHVHPSVYNILYKLKPDGIVLITDCMRAGGMPDGEYSLGGQPVFKNGIACRLKDGTVAGSVLTLNKAVKNVWQHTGLPLCEVVKMASLRPARLIGEDREIGSLSVGKRADIVIADEEMSVKKTIIGGK